MPKVKILFVVADFYQGGAERYAYEIDHAIDKKKFEIAILCTNTQENSDQKWNRFFDSKHLELGTKITYIDSFSINRKDTLEVRLLRKINKDYKKEKFNFKKLIPFLESYDLIHWMGEYTVIHHLPESIMKRSIVNSMSAKFQNPNIYKAFDFDYKYNFISGFTKNEFEFEYNQFKKINHWFFPLILNLKDQKNNWKYTENEIKKIGIFTRLDKYKPLDPFFYSFQLLLDQMPNCELHIFGNGDPEIEGMNRYLRNLNLIDKVIFRGHQEDIVQTVQKEHVDLAWFQGYNNDRPAGYAGFDICSTGTPLLCWDFFDKPKEEPSLIYPHYKNLTQFVNKSIQILSNAEAANELSKIQFEDVKNNRDANKIVMEMEKIYEEVLSQKK